MIPLQNQNQIFFREIGGVSGPPPPVGCGTPTDAVIISGAGNAGANGTYFQNPASPNIWNNANDPQARIVGFAGVYTLYYGLAAHELYVTSSANFPCTWEVGLDGVAPAPTGLYVDVPFWAPATAVASWVDSGGPNSGNLAAFKATADFATVSSLDLTSTGITVLNVKLRLPALGSLTVSGNSLASLDVGGMTSLGFLDVSSNLGLASLIVSGCINLSTLDCHSCALTSLDCSGLVSLVTFDASANTGPITTLNFTNCAVIDPLNLSLGGGYGSLTSVIVTGCTGLTSLDVTLNNLTSMDVSTCVALITFSCPQNPGLTSVNINGATSLTDVDCSQCALTSIDLSSNVNLVNLFLFNNQITSLDVSACVALSTCACFINQLTALTGLANCLSIASVQTDVNLLNQAAVDTVLCDLDSTGAVNGLLDYSANAPAGPAGLVCRASLTGKGWTIAP